MASSALTLNRALAAGLVAAISWSALRPYDWLTWFLEAAPALFGLAIILATHRRFPLTLLSTILLWLGGVMVLIGAHYTYARVPLFDWVKDQFGLERNHYDRFGHFMQGLIPAIVVRELILRTSCLKSGFWLWVLVLSVCMAKSMLYELIEWGAAVLLGNSSTDFLGTQGDEWDAQADMFLATAGAVLALLTLTRLHDRQLHRLRNL